MDQNFMIIDSNQPSEQDSDFIYNWKIMLKNSEVK